MKRFLVCLFLAIAIILSACALTSNTSTEVDYLFPEAVVEAREYVNHSAVSKAYLKYHLRCAGFNEEETNYAVDNCDADWNQEAVEAIQNFIKGYADTTLQDLLFELNTKGFTEEEIYFAIKYLSTKGSSN